MFDGCFADVLSSVGDDFEVALRIVVESQLLQQRLIQRSSRCCCQHPNAPCIASRTLLRSSHNCKTLRLAELDMFFPSGSNLHYPLYASTPIAPVIVREEPSSTPGNYRNSTKSVLGLERRDSIRMLRGYRRRTLVIRIIYRTSREHSQIIPQLIGIGLHNQLCLNLFFVR